MNRLLIIACSQRKSSARGRIPAINRYDGPAFRVLRKYLCHATGPTPSVLILSAKHGLIRADRMIANYDHRLSRASAARMRPEVLRVFNQVLSSGKLDVIGVCAGKDYRLSIAGLAEQIPEGIRLDFIEGGQGRRLTALKGWLERTD